MSFRKTTLSLGILSILGLSAGTAGQATAGGCEHRAGMHAFHQPGVMAPAASPWGYASHDPRMIAAMGLHQAMHWDSPAARATTVWTAEPAAPAPGDVVDVALGAGSFNTLAAALQGAGLVDTLKGEGPFTVFAPTDAAFAKIPKEQLNALLGDKEALAAVLTYHVVPGRVMAADVAELETAKTVQGGSITIDTSDGVKVDGANVIKTDVLASNGVIHVIDTVIMPKKN